MGRVRRPFKRPENKRSAKLIVIATEGRQTERIYFEKLAEEFDSPHVHVKILGKLNNNSNPEEVLEELNSFANFYKLEDDDELWMVIDRDFQSWNEKMIKSVAQKCHQKKGYFLGLSNPAFEIWLLLHVIDIYKMNDEEKRKIYLNRKVNRNKTYCKKKLSDILGGFNEANYDPSNICSESQGCNTKG